MIVTLKCLVDVVGKPDAKGVAKIVKRNVQFLRQFESTMILAEQYINAKGTVSKKWCFIKEGETYYKMNHKFEEIEKLTKHKQVKGFI